MCPAAAGNGETTERPAAAAAEMPGYTPATAAGGDQ